MPQISKHIKALFSTQKWSREQLADGNYLYSGSLIEYDGNDLEQGDVVYLVDPAGNVSVLPDGSYPRKSGGTFVIQDGAVSSVTGPTTPAYKEEPTPQAQSAEQTSSAQSHSNQTPEMETTQTDPILTEQAGDTSATDTKTVATATVDINDLIAQALIPVFEQIAGLQQLIATQVLCSTEIKTALSKVETDVTKIANSPSGTPAEKEINTYTGPSAAIKDHPMAKYMS